jgi:hypothetical protein
MNEGNPSNPTKNALRWRVLDQTIAEIRTGFADLSAEAADTLIDEAVAAVRQAHKARATKAT